MASTAFDRRRINGPEESFSPVFEEGHTSTAIDGDATGFRPIFLRTGLISQANGSAYIETEKMKIACAVYGPRQSKSATYSGKGRLNVEVKFAPFSCTTRRAPMREAEDRAVGLLVHQALAPAVRLELYPKAMLDVFIFIIEGESGGTEGFASAACAASATVVAGTALAHAGVDMLGLIVSCTAATVPDGIWLDPPAEVAAKALGRLTLACIPALGLVSSMWQTGQMSIEEVEKCMDACQERCLDIHAVVVQALRETGAESDAS